MAHMHYKGTGQMHSFRGLLVDGGQDKIRIQGPTGEIAWRITKFQIIREAPTASIDHVVKILREKVTTVPESSAKIDLTESELLAVAAISGTTFGEIYTTIIFDNSLFSRNIYVTHTDNDGSEGCNYYIELEEVKVGKSGMAQLSLAAARRVQSDV